MKRVNNHPFLVGEKMKKYIKYMIPSLITTIILLIIFYRNDLYPFMDNSIVQVDADYQFIPVLYKIFDIIHGHGNLFYSSIGLGNSIYTSMIIQGSIFSPITLLLYFTSRDNINNYFNILIIVKMALLSLTSYIYFKYKFRVREFYLILFSVVYAFSGWVLLNYFNIMWLDSVILFPLIMLYLDKLIKDNNYCGYIITLALSFIISYYITTFILIFVFIYSYFNVLIIEPREKEKKTILMLGLSTVIAILISSFSVVPALYHTFNSSRLSSGGNYDLLANTINKIIYLMGMSLPTVLLFMMIFKYKNDKKRIFVYLSLLVLYSIGIVLEPINATMHFGSYWSFPYRYSFITIFIMISISLYYLSKYDIKEGKIRIIPMILISILIGVVIYLNSIYYYDIKNSQITLDFNDFSIFKYMLIMLIIFLFMKIFTLLIRNRIFVKIFLVITTLVEIFITSSWAMYYSSGYYLVKEARELNNTLELSNNNIDRYKIDYPYYSIDYPFMLDVPALDNWLHILPRGMTNTYKSLGYLISDTSIKATGGTIFTDNLLNLNYVISKRELDNRIYDPINTSEKYKLYKYIDKIGFGVVYPSNNIITDNELEGFDLQNNIYNSLFNTKEELIDIKTFYISDESNCLNISDNIDSDSYIYLDFTNFGNDINTLKVNNEYLYNLDNYIEYLGIYNGDIDIEICPKEDRYLESVDLGIIPIHRYNEFVNSMKQDVKVSYDNGYFIEVFNDEDDRSLFLPINNIKGLDIKLNGKKVKADRYLDNFISIKLSKGSNKITIKYHEPYFLISILLSIIGIVMLFILKYLKLNNKYLLNISYYIFIVMGILIYLYFYVYSFIK